MTQAFPIPAMQDVMLTVEDLHDINFSEFEFRSRFELTDHFNEADYLMLRKGKTRVRAIGPTATENMTFHVAWQCRRGPGGRWTLVRCMTSSTPMHDSRDADVLLKVMEEIFPDGCLYDVPSFE